MFKNHLKVAFRSIWNNKFYSAISILGLAIGIAAFTISIQAIKAALANPVKSLRTE